MNLRAATLCAGAGEDYYEGAGENLEVEPDDPLVDVSHIKRDVVIEGGVLAGLHLPEAGDAGHDVEAAQVVELVLANLAGQRRARADDA